MSMAHGKKALAQKPSKTCGRFHDDRQEAGESWSATPGNLHGILFRCPGAEPGGMDTDVDSRLPMFAEKKCMVITEELYPS